MTPSNKGDHKHGLSCHISYELNSVGWWFIISNLLFTELNILNNLVGWIIFLIKQLEGFDTIRQASLYLYINLIAEIKSEEENILA